MSKELIAKLILIAAKQSRPYDCYAVFNHNNEVYNIRQYQDILPSETAVRLIKNSDGNLLESIRIAVQDIQLLNV